MQKAMLFATIGCSVLWTLNGLMRLIGVYRFKDGGSAKEGWVYLAVGAGWAFTAWIPELWNWGFPTLLSVAIALEWDKRSSKSVVKNKAD